MSRFFAKPTNFIVLVLTVTCVPLALFRSAEYFVVLFAGVIVLEREVRVALLSHDWKVNR